MSGEASRGGVFFDNRGEEKTAKVTMLERSESDFLRRSE